MMTTPKKKGKKSVATNLFFFLLFSFCYGSAQQNESEPCQNQTAQNSQSRNEARRKFLATLSPQEFSVAAALLFLLFTLILEKKRGKKKTLDLTNKMPFG